MPADHARRQPRRGRATIAHSAPATEVWLLSERSREIKFYRIRFLPGNKNATPTVLQTRETRSRRAIMAGNFNRRDFLKLAGIGGVVFASGIGCSAGRNGRAAADAAESGEFFFFPFCGNH